jgi:hypothetical protein
MDRFSGALLVGRVRVCSAPASWRGVHVYGVARQLDPDQDHAVGNWVWECTSGRTCLAGRACTHLGQQLI